MKPTLRVAALSALSALSALLLCAGCASSGSSSADAASGDSGSGAASGWAGRYLPLHGGWDAEHAKPDAGVEVNLADDAPHGVSGAVANPVAVGHHALLLRLQPTGDALVQEQLEVKERVPLPLQTQEGDDAPQVMSTATLWPGLYRVELTRLPQGALLLAFHVQPSAAELEAPPRESGGRTDVSLYLVRAGE